MSEQLNISCRSLLRVAIPMSFGAFIQFSVVFIDNFFVSKISGNAMSGVAYVSLIYITLIMIGVGLGNAAQILIARRNGEKNKTAAGSILVNALLISLAVASLQFFLLFFIAPPLLDYFISSKQVLGYMKEFIGFRSIGFFFYTPVLILNSFWSGIARTRVMAYETIITGTCNILLDYGLIFGNLGFPEMGVAGAAIATSASEACAFFFLTAYTLSRKEFKTFHLRTAFASLPLAHSKALMKLGIPIMLQSVLSLGVWLVFYNFIEKLGEKSLQSSLITRNMYMLVWVSVMGFSTTAKTYVSGLIAEGRQVDLWPTIRRIMLLNFSGIFLLSHGLWLYPEFIAQQFSSDAEVISLSVDSMRVVLPAMYLFSFTSILLSTVEGSGNALAGFAVEAITTIFYIITAYLLAIQWAKPVYIVWTADYVYFSLLGLLSIIFLWNGKWKHKTI
ncbi:MAG: MATE family efflux transporter [Crocinitomicaceae bacterium]|nr:MATE family efflux transporter [Crocinitomicaceae bacterium]